MKKTLTTLFLFLTFACLNFLQAQTPAPAPAVFDPLGKTEDEITAQWGAPTSRMDLGSESQLFYAKGAVTFEDGKAVKFKAADSSQTTSVARPRTSSSSSEASPGSLSKAGKTREREEQELMIKRLQDELSDKRNELRDKENSKDKQEIQDRFQDAVKRLGANYYNSANYSIQYKNLEKQRDDDLAQLDRRQGISQLKEDIKKLEEEITEKQRELYR